MRIGVSEIMRAIMADQFSNLRINVRTHHQEDKSHLKFHSGYFIETIAPAARANVVVCGAA